MKNLGVYIHIPFCAQKCAYCDFYSLAGRQQLMPEYQKALLHHINESAQQLSGYYVDTVYFGGGTPSFYGYDRLIEIFNTLKLCGNVLVDSEVTAEVNPDSVTKAGLQKLRKAGFNRLSIGVQATDDETLKRLGRIHTFEDVENAVYTARSVGFKNISIDLMYGLPSQTTESWAETLTKAVSLKPDHISCYGLKLAEGTEMYVYKDSPFIPDDDIQADMYLYAVEALSRYGYRQYEISNFAKKGYESQHNLKYWTGQEYIGFGAAAHSFVGNKRYSNISSVSEYSLGVLKNGAIVDQHEKISAFERASEYLMLGLRTVHGISAKEYRKIYPADFAPLEKALKSCEKYGWAVFNGERWHFTPRGFLLSNILIGQILDSQVSQDFPQPRPWMTEYQKQERSRLLSLNSIGGAESIFRGI